MPKKTTIEADRVAAQAQRLDRGLQILAVLREGPATSLEIGERLDLDKRTVNRMLAVLRKHGFVDQDVTRGEGSDWRSLYHRLDPTGAWIPRKE